MAYVSDSDYEKKIPKGDWQDCPDCPNTGRQNPDGDQCCFCYTNPWSVFVEVSPDIGFSPDRLIGRSGLLEIKNRIAKTQLKIILAGRMPPGDRWQVQFSMWAGKKKYCDYVSFCPFLDDPNEKYFYQKIEMKETLIAGIRSEVVRFLNEMKQMESALKKEQYMGELFT